MSTSNVQFSDPTPVCRKCKGVLSNRYVICRHCQPQTAGRAPDTRRPRALTSAEATAMVEAEALATMRYERRQRIFAAQIADMESAVNAPWQSAELGQGWSFEGRPMPAALPLQ